MCSALIAVSSKITSQNCRGFFQRNLVNQRLASTPRLGLSFEAGTALELLVIVELLNYELDVGLHVAVALGNLRHAAIGSDQITQEVTVISPQSQLTSLERHLNFRSIKKPPADFSGAADTIFPVRIYASTHVRSSSDVRKEPT